MNDKTPGEAPGAGVKIRSRDGVLELVLDRPERKNALDVAMISGMIEALEAASTDESVRVILLRSSGDTFCAGADWVTTNRGDAGAPRPRTGAIQRRTAVQAHRLVWLLCEVQLPVVCAVGGWAAGLGCQLALAADFAVATESSRFWEPFLERGFTPDSGATWLLPRLIGLGRAKELLMLGREVSGREAADWGMIHRAVPDAELDSAVAELVEQLGSAATVALGLTKRCIHRALTGSLMEAMEAEANGLELSSRTVDFKEGLTAFRERRPPRFEGR